METPPPCDFSDGLSPGSSIGSVDSTIAMNGAMTPYELSPAGFMEEDFFGVDGGKAQDDETVWLEMATFGEHSPVSATLSPAIQNLSLPSPAMPGLTLPSPDFLPLPGYLSAPLTPMSLPMPNEPQPDCHHGNVIDTLLCDVMQSQWPAVSSPSPLTTLRDTIGQLRSVSECALCVSSCKSMALILVIAKAVVGHVAGLVHDPAACGSSLQLGTYSADSVEECAFVHGQIVRRHVGRFADVVDCFAGDAQRAGWVANGAALRGMAEEARKLAQ